MHYVCKCMCDLLLVSQALIVNISGLKVNIKFLRLYQNEKSTSIHHVHNSVICLSMFKSRKVKSDYCKPRKS